MEPVTVCSWPLRRTVKTTGVPLWAPTAAPIWSCCLTYVSPLIGLPSTAMITSPGLSALAAGLFCSILPTTGGGSTVPWFMKTAAKMMNASAMLTNGPAAITTIRFHTGWR